MRAGEMRGKLWTWAISWILFFSENGRGNNRCNHPNDLLKATIRRWMMVNRWAEGRMGVCGQSRHVKYFCPSLRTGEAAASRCEVFSGLDTCHVRESGTCFAEAPVSRLPEPPGWPLCSASLPSPVVAPAPVWSLLTASLWPKRNPAAVTDGSPSISLTQSSVRCL